MRTIRPEPLLTRVPPGFPDGDPETNVGFSDALTLVGALEDCADAPP